MTVNIIILPFHWHAFWKLNLASTNEESSRNCGRNL